MTAMRPDPLEACLLHLLEHHGLPQSRAALRARIDTTDGPWQLDDFIQVAEACGLQVEVVRGGPLPMASIQRPVLLPQAAGGPRVWLEADGAAQRVFDGHSGRSVPASTDDLSQWHAGVHAVVSLTRPARHSAQGVQQAVGRRGHWFWGPVLMASPLYRRAAAAAVLTNLFALATSIFAMIVYDRVIPNQAMGTLTALLMGVGIVLVADLVIRLLRGHFIDAAAARADAEIADALFDQVLDLDLQARRRASGSLASLLNQFEGMRDFFTSATLSVVIDLPFAILFVVVLAWVGGPMAWVPAVALLLVLVLGLAVQPGLRRLAAQAQLDSQTKQSVLVETLTGLETIKALGAGGAMRRRWRHAVVDQARVMLGTRRLEHLATHGTNLVFLAAQIAVVTVGALLAMEGRIGTGAVVAGSILCGRAIQPLAQIAQWLARWHQALASWRALNQLMALPREHPPGLVRAAPRQLQPSLELQEVTCRYPDREAPALDKVSLRIGAGERVAVIGRVGSGKSTLLKLLLGLLSPQGGCVLLGGLDSRQIDPADLRRQVAAVLQEPWLASGTLRQNLVLGADHPDDDAVLQAAQVAGVLDLVNADPQGWQRVVGERGEGLSGGQRQAVALARALVGRPSVLLLDEPTSAMDATAERELLQRMKPALQGMTLVLVTHKPSMLELVDKVAVLDRGRLLAYGPKAEVLKIAAGSGRPA